MMTSQRFPLPRLLTMGLSLLVFLGSGSVAVADTPTRAETALQKAETLEQRVAETDAIEPAPDAERLTREGVRAVDPQGRASLDDAITCLSRSIYWEAKGAGQLEMEAVANVIMNRLANPGFPSTLCGVVQQGSESGPCQFSWWCDGRPDGVNEPKEYAAAREIARRALNGTLPDRTGGALFFHHRSISPSWVSHLVKTTQTHEFDFYRRPS